MTLQTVPFFSRYMNYGSRTAQRQNSSSGFEYRRSFLNSLLHLVDRLLIYPVPHYYFIHFYVVSVVSSLFWGFQSTMKGSAVTALAKYEPVTASTMSLEQVVLVWALMITQGIRRLLESITLLKRSSSTMPIVHYLIGIVFYLSIGVGVWIEGSSQRDPRA